MSASDRARRVQDLFAAAAPLPRDRRESFLTARCDDPSVVEEVLSLLGSLDSTNTGELLPPLFPSDADPLKPGERLGPYTILRRIGEGGMGVVYLVEREDVGMRAATKLVRYGWLATAEEVDRFLQERRVLARLHHAGIARLFDAGVTQEGLPYLIMEYVEGERIDDHCDRRGLGMEARLRLAVRVCTALEHAHRQGIVHRDLKPDHVLITAEGDPKILDFGVAVLVEGVAHPEGATGLGTGHGVLGTPAYASPEQIRGEPLTPASDVYSLGIVLHQLLTGHHPHRHAQRRRLRGDLDAILNKALAADPARRYPSAGALAADLDAHLRGAPVQARLGSRAYRVRKGAVRIARHPLVLGAASLASAALLGSLLAGDPDRGRGRPELPPGDEIPAAAASRTMAVFPFAVRGDPGSDYLAEGLAELLGRAMDGAGGLRSVDSHAWLASLQETGVPPLEPRRAADVAARFGADLFVLGSVAEASGRLRIAAHLYERPQSGPIRTITQAEVEGTTDELFRLTDLLAAELLAGQYPGPSEQMTRTAVATTAVLPALKAYLRGENLYRRGIYQDAVSAFQEAVAADSGFALAYYRMSFTAMSTDQGDLMKTAADAAIRHAGRLPHRDSLRIAAFYARLQGDVREGERLYRRLLSRHPGDRQGEFDLSDLLFHHNPFYGRSVLEARPGLERSLASRPFARESADHLLKIAALQGDTALVGRVEQRLREMNPQDRLLSFARLVRAALRLESPSAEAVLAENRELGDIQLFSRVWWIGTYAKNLDFTARVAQLLTEPSRALEVRAWGHLSRADVALARGQRRAAELELTRAARFAAPRALELRAFYAVLPHVPTPRARLLAMRDSLARQDPEVVAGASSPPFADFYPGARPAVRLYVSGLLSERLGELEEAERFARELDAVTTPEVADHYARILAAGVRSRIALGQNRPQQALDLLEEAGLDVPRAWNPVHFATNAAERFMRAEALHALGRYDEALDWYASLGEVSIGDLVYLAPAHLARATIYEHLGDRARAAEHYARTRELWRDADPELAAIRVQAEAGLARTGAGG